MQGPRFLSLGMTISFWEDSRLWRRCRCSGVKFEGARRDMYKCCKWSVKVLMWNRISNGISRVGGSQLDRRKSLEGCQVDGS